MPLHLSFPTFRKPRASWFACFDKSGWQTLTRAPIYDRANVFLTPCFCNILYCAITHCLPALSFLSFLPFLFNFSFSLSLSRSLSLSLQITVLYCAVQAIHVDVYSNVQFDQAHSSQSSIVKTLGNT